MPRLSMPAGLGARGGCVGRRGEAGGSRRQGEMSVMASFPFHNS